MYESYEGDESAVRVGIHAERVTRPRSKCSRPTWREPKRSWKSWARSSGVASCTSVDWDWWVVRRRTKVSAVASLPSPSLSLVSLPPPHLPAPVRCPVVLQVVNSEQQKGLLGGCGLGALTGGARGIKHLACLRGMRLSSCEEEAAAQVGGGAA